MTRLHSVTLVNRGDRTAGVREDQSILEAFESLGEALPAGCRYPRLLEHRERPPRHRLRARG